MPFYAFGLNHHTADIALRERVAFVANELQKAHSSLLGEEGIEECVLLSTCNRTELMVTSEHAKDQVESQLLSWLSRAKNIDANALAESYYLYAEERAARHVIRVAAGLDSLILGEPQIFGQLKSAVSIAREQSTIGPKLGDLLDLVFRAVKRVRTRTAIGRSPVSVAYAAVNLAQRIFADLASSSVLLIGAGDTAELVALHFKEKGCTNITVANRSLPNALKLSEKFDGQAVLLSELHDHLTQADIIVSSTASQLPILGKGAMESAVQNRKRKPVFIIDLAVPRDVEQEVADIDDIYLYTVDDLSKVIDEGKKMREQAALEAERFVEEAVLEWQQQGREREANTSVKALRAELIELREKELERARKALASGESADIVVAQLAHALTQKMLHTPTKNLRQAARENDQRSIDIFRKMMGFITTKEDKAPNDKSS